MPVFPLVNRDPATVQYYSLFKGGYVFDVGNGYGGNVAQAVADANSSPPGGTLVFEPGIYTIGSTITITRAQSWLGLGGWGANDANGARIVAASGLNANMIAFSGSGAMNGCEFRNLILDGNQANQTAGNTFYAIGALHCLWDHCHFTRHWQNGLHLLQDGAGGTGHHNRVTNCLFDNGESSPGGDGRGLRIEGSDENFIYACDFENNGRPAAPEPNQVFDLSGLNFFWGGTCVGGQTGIKIQGDRSKVTDWTFDGVKNHQVRLNGSRNLVEGCTFLNIGFTGAANTLDGVYVDNVDANRISSCTFLPDGGGGCRSGVNLAPATASTNTAVENNSFETSSGSYGTGAIIGNTGTGNRIRNNKGWNPRGSVTAPGIPASTTPLTNNTGYDCMVLVTGGTVTNVGLGGTNTGQTSGWFRVPATQTITLTYSVAPTWTWWAD